MSNLDLFGNNDREQRLIEAAQNMYNLLKLCAERLELLHYNSDAKNIRALLNKIDGKDGRNYGKG